MTTTTNNTTAKRTVTISVDLFAAARKAEEGFFVGLSDTDVIETAARYEKFLTLVQRYPDTLVSPSRDIDEMWHLHMLHPIAYYHDCMANFGEILDHDGGFGSASEEEWGELISIFDATAELWRREFGEEYAPAEARVKATKCAKACAKCATKCRTACKK